MAFKMTHPFKQTNDSKTMTEEERLKKYHLEKLAEDLASATTAAAKERIQKLIDAAKKKNK